MSDGVMELVPDDMRRRMRNWARARAGLLASMGITSTSIYDGPIRVDRNPESRLPILEGEAKDTDEALRKVPARYRQAVELYWDYEGQSLRRLAKRTGKVGVNHETFKAWVIKGHQLLEEAVAACTAKWRGVHEENRRRTLAAA